MANVTPTASDAPQTAAGSVSLPRLRRLNLIVGGLHGVQAIAILALAGLGATLPVQLSYLEGPPGAGDRGGPVELFALPIGLAVAIFLLLAAADHLSTATWARDWYERTVPRGVNPARWWEYSLSASLMVVLIAMLAGVTEATALIALFGVNASMILFGLVMERTNVDRDTVDWKPFVYGCIAGAVPWIAIALQLIVSSAEGSSPPTFVYVIFVTLFALFNSFALNMWLQYRGRGRWSDPLHAERVYLILSLVAKSVLAWQVYAGAIAGA